VDPFACLSFSKPSFGPIGASSPNIDWFPFFVDPFVFANNSQTKTQPQSFRVPSFIIIASWEGTPGRVDQFSTLFLFGKSLVSREHEDNEARFPSFQALSIAQSSDPIHDGCSEVFGATTNNNSFENEGVTIELESLSPPLACVIGSATYHKGNTFYKEGQFPTHSFLCLNS